MIVHYELFIGLAVLAILILLLSFYLVNVFLLQREMFMMHFIMKVIERMKETFSEVKTISDPHQPVKCTCYCQVYV